MNKILCWTLTVLFLLVNSCSHHPAVSSVAKVNLEILKSHTTLKSLTHEELLHSLEVKNLKVWEPHEEREIEYRGVSVVSLLDLYLGPTWSQHAEVLFVALDGYKSGISTEKIKKYNPLLAFQRNDQKSFTLNNKMQGEENIEVGPYYLVWDNLKNPELKPEGAYGWPYQVAQLNLVDLQDLYPKTAPTLKASAVVKEGFLHYKRYCISCHALKGEGGVKAPALDGISKYMGKKDLVSWMLNPRKFIPTTTMPALAENLIQPERQKRAELIYEYLKNY